MGAKQLRQIYYTFHIVDLMRLPGRILLNAALCEPGSPGSVLHATGRVA